YDYSENHFLLDTAYKSSFVDYFNSPDNQYDDSTLSRRIIIEAPTDFEVWVQTDNTTSNKRFGVATTMLYPRPGGLLDPGGYDNDTNVTSTRQEPGIRFAGYFRKLDPSEY